MIGKTNVSGISNGGKMRLVNFADGTDEEIVAMIEAHYAGKINIGDFWAVGDTRLVHLNAMPAENGNNRAHIAQFIYVNIIGIEHDDLKEAINDKTKAAITIQCQELLGNNGKEETVFPWGKSMGTIKDTQIWDSNPMRNWFNITFVNALPEKLKINVKTVIKKNMSNHSGKDATCITTEDKAFWLSYPEVFGDVSYGYYKGNATLEGNQYNYYEISSNLKKYINNQTEKGEAYSWWLRSPSSQHSSDTNYDYWCNVSMQGNRNYWHSQDREGNAPAFCL